MRPVARMAIAAATTLAVTLPISGAASADPTPPVPSRAKVDKAREAVVSKRQLVKQLEAQLAAANARLEQASLEASIAAEAYNGAVYKLSEARKAYSVAQAQEKQAKADVAAQRDAIVALVTESYQNGTELNSATAILSDEGPAGLMNRFAVVQSAGDSMEAHYDAYRKASARAEVATAKALKARKHQQTLAAEARKLRDEASAAANNAAVAAGQIAVQRQQLIQALARAQDISVELAGKRQAVLERIARQKAAAAARAREAAEAAALEKAAREAKREANQAKKDQKKAETSDDGIDLTGGDAGPPVSDNPPAPGTGVRRVIAYARAQLGKPYKWGGAGPNSFDCSGLTMMAWRAGGKSLPHWSVAQFQQSTRISVGQLRPGDLVFWGSSPGSIHHVAMYIGNGQIIHASRTGQPVQISSMYYWVPPDYFARP